jgi:hypothetical protein
MRCGWTPSPTCASGTGTNNENLPETHAVLRRIRRELDAAFSNRMLLAEANQWPADVRDYFGDGDECHMAFHFPLMPRMFMAVRQEDRHAITEILNQTPDIPESCQWALFLRNHDELTLEMVTDEERDYMYQAYAADPLMRLNVGIRRRLAPLVENSRRRIELLNMLLFSMPGTPILYYGDELGMGDNIYLGDRNGVRTPMQWSGDRNGGFSRADTARLFAPPVVDPGVRLPGGQRRGARTIAVLAVELDEAADRLAPAAPGVRPRHTRVRLLLEPEGARLPAAGCRRDGAGPGESVENSAAGGGRSVVVLRTHSGGDAGTDRVPASHRGPARVFHAGSICGALVLDWTTQPCPSSRRRWRHPTNRRVRRWLRICQRSSLA